MWLSRTTLVTCNFFPVPSDRAIALHLTTPSSVRVVQYVERLPCLADTVLVTTTGQSLIIRKEKENTPDDHTLSSLFIHMLKSRSFCFWVDSSHTNEGTTEQKKWLKTQVPKWCKTQKCGWTVRTPAHWTTECMGTANCYWHSGGCNFDILPWRRPRTERIPSRIHTNRYSVCQFTFVCCTGLLVACWLPNIWPFVNQCCSRVTSGWEGSH